MVSVSTILAGLSAVAASSVSASLTSLPTFNIPSFDYATLTQGDAPQRVLQSLQQDGIIALKNIPNYANLRERYLREAAQCAAINADPARDTFVSRKLFKDGTNRMTISTNAGRELAGSAIETDQACPGYRQLYEEFSATMERAVNTLGSTLDSTSFTASDGHKAISSRQLIGEAVRLDHFHAYEAAVSTTKGESGRQLQASDLSLPLHEDHGLFIAMSAPKFYQVDSTDARRLEEQALAEDASGLVIQTSSGQRVRPVLNADEVVIMMGTGASRWLKTSHAIPAVMHGMQMPEVMTSASGRRSLRAWFGKMTLLPAYQRMLLNNGMAFEEHVNTTTRYLLTEDSSDLKAVGCATGRHLTPSEGKCTLRTCTLKAGASAPEEPCSVICNREGHSEDDAPTCAEKCSCTSSSSPAERCWMLCVANLPSDKCALSSQTCNGQEIKCTASPTPSTTTPSTTKPTSSPGPTTTPTPTTPGTTTKAPSPTTPGETTASPSSTPASGSTDATTSGSLPSSSNDSTVSPATSAVPSTTPASTNGASSMVTISSVVASVVVATVALL